MHDQRHSNTPGYTVILAGTLLSLAASLVPHFDAGYRLMPLVFITGMVPYMVYAIAVPLLRSALVTAAGVLIVVAHTWLLFNQRFVDYVDYSDGLIYVIPTTLTIVAAPVAIIALKKSRGY